MRKLNSMSSNDVAFVETVTSWWSKEMEERVRDHGWNAYIVTFTFNHIPGQPATKLKMMQDCVCRFYSKMVTRVVRKPNSMHQLFNRPRMMTAPDYPVFKHEKIGLAAATVNDGLHLHSILALPLKATERGNRIPRRAEATPLYQSATPQNSFRTDRRQYGRRHGLCDENGKAWKMSLGGCFLPT
jgi:hypothetical protein